MIVTTNDRGRFWWLLLLWPPFLLELLFHAVFEGFFGTLGYVVRKYPILMPQAIAGIGAVTGHLFWETAGATVLGLFIGWAVALFSLVFDDPWAKRAVEIPTTNSSASTEKPGSSEF